METVNTCLLNDRLSPFHSPTLLRDSDHVSHSLDEEKGSEKGSEWPPSLGLKLESRVAPCIAPGGS